MERQFFTTLTIDELRQVINEEVSTVLDQRTIEKPDNETDKLLSIDEVSDLLKVSKVTIHKWKRKGILPYCRMGRRIYFKESEIFNSLKHKTKNHDRYN